MKFYVNQPYSSFNRIKRFIKDEDISIYSYNGDLVRIVNYDYVMKNRDLFCNVIDEDFYKDYIFPCKEGSLHLEPLHCEMASNIPWLLSTRVYYKLIQTEPFPIVNAYFMLDDCFVVYYSLSNQECLPKLIRGNKKEVVLYKFFDYNIMNIVQGLSSCTIRLHVLTEDYAKFNILYFFEGDINNTKVSDIFVYDKGKLTCESKEMSYPSKIDFTRGVFLGELSSSLDDLLKK